MNLSLSILVAAIALAPLDLGALLAEADRANPELLARSSRAAAAAEIAPQRSALPDPKLSVSYTNDGLTSFTLGSSQFSNVTFRWDQDVPYRSVRKGASELAVAEAGVALAAETSQRAQLRVRVVALYGAIWRAERMAALLTESRALLVTSVEAARARYESGTGNQEGVLRAQTEVRRLDLEREALARERRLAEIALTEALGRSADSRFGPAGPLPDAAVPDTEALEDAAAGSAPATLEARAVEASADAAVANAHVQTRPEWGWMAAYQFLGGLDPMVMGGFTVRLPVWKDSKQARGINEAERTAEAAAHERDAIEIAQRTLVRRLSEELASIDRQRRLYDQAVLPEAAATLDAARAAYAAGRAEMTLVLEDFNRLLADRRVAIDLDAQRLVAIASLEAATGTSLLVIPGTGDTR